MTESSENTGNANEEIRELNDTHVLLVDDEDGVRKLAQMVLEGAGFKVRSFDDPEKALERYAADTPEDREDIIVSDVLMPGLKGPELVEALKKINGRIRVVFMSGNIGNYKTEDLEEKGPLVQKPFQPLSALTDAVREVIGQ